jgi:hypothetical protein
MKIDPPGAELMSLQASPSATTRQVAAFLLISKQYFKYTILKLLFFRAD